MVFFHATAERSEDSPTPEAWQPYVHGRIEAYAVAVGHYQMMQPGSLAQIGPVLAARLRDLTRTRGQLDAWTYGRALKDFTLLKPAGDTPSSI